jgi:hypothetical protein
MFLEPKCNSSSKQNICFKKKKKKKNFFHPSATDLKKLVNDLPREENENEKSAGGMQKRARKSTPSPELSESKSKSFSKKKSESKDSKRKEKAEEEEDSEGGRESEENSDSIAVRSNFDPMACFEPNLETDAKNGTVEFSFQLPDNLTRYRIWAVAYTENYFGIGECKCELFMYLFIE